MTRRSTRIPASPTCWKTHAIRTLAFAAQRSWTPTSIIGSKHSFGLIRRPLAARQRSVDVALKISPVELGYKAYSSHSVFNLASSLELSHLVHSIKCRQCEQSWSIYRTLRRNNRNVIIPTDVLGDLYSLLRYARTLAISENSMSKKDRQLEALLNDIHLQGLSKEEFLKYVKDIPIPNYKLLHRSIRAEDHELAVRIFREMMHTGEALQLSRMWMYNLLDMLSAKGEQFYNEIMAYLVDNDVYKLSRKDMDAAVSIYSKLSSMDTEVAAGQMLEYARHNLSSHNFANMIWMIHHWKQFDVIEEVMDIAKDRGIAPNCECLVLLMRYYRQSKQHTKAFETFQELLESDMKPSIQAFNTFLQVLADQKATDKISIMIQAMIDRGYQPDIATFSEAMKANSQPETLQACIEYYHMMRDHGIQPNQYSYNILINAFSKANDMPEVIRWFQTMIADGVIPNHVTITTLIKAFTKEKASSSPEKSVLQIFEQGKAAGIKADVVLYTALINTFAKSANMHGALATHSDMLSEGIDPNVYTYTSLIEACISSAQMDVAQKIFDLMKESDHKKPNAFTYCILLKAWIKLRSFDKVKGLYQETMDLLQAGAIETDHVLTDVLHECQLILEDTKTASELLECTVD
jgi:pentatricopeptide repeat protein